MATTFADIIMLALGIDDTQFKKRLSDSADAYKKHREEFDRNTKNIQTSANGLQLALNGLKSAVDEFYGVVAKGLTVGALGKMAIDAAASTEALRHLENRLNQSGAFTVAQPGILVCIPNREHMVEPMLGTKWRIELDPEKADFVIESERSRCAADHPSLILIDEVTRYSRAFAWTYVNERSSYFNPAFGHGCCMTATIRDGGPAR